MKDSLKNMKHLLWLYFAFFVGSALLPSNAAAQSPACRSEQNLSISFCDDYDTGFYTCTGSCVRCHRTESLGGHSYYCNCQTGATSLSPSAELERRCGAFDSDAEYFSWKREREAESLRIEELRRAQAADLAREERAALSAAQQNFASVCRQRFEEEACNCLNSQLSEVDSGALISASNGLDENRLVAFIGRNLGQDGISCIIER